ncbi:hypothetical protein B566_EDAN015436 [Ephemera danica]|nr:hypothetical protein B566_EDAN015436 [Ephemera danica]
MESCSPCASRFSSYMGGGPAALGMYPYQAGVMWDGQLICGCVILNANSALTAAHCMYNNLVQDFYIMAGSQDLSTLERLTPSSITFYTPSSPPLVASPTTLLFSTLVDPPFVFDGFLQTAPLSVDLQVYSDLECLQTWIFGPAKTNICAGQPPGEIGAGACGGDSGSALVINGEVAGISSFEHVPCGTRPQPAVFTQVSLYIDWITETAGL